MLRNFWLLTGLALVWAAGCSSDKPDMMNMDCTGPDCKPPQADMAGPDTRPQECTAPRGDLRKAVVNRLILPTANSPCSIDVDGDKNPDNALTLVATGIKSLFDIQKSADDAIRAGAMVQLAQVQSEDFTRSDCAGITLQRGMPTERPPALDGSDSFKVDAAVMAAQLRGRIENAQFESPRPIEQTSATLAKVELALPAGFGVDVPLPISGAHIQGMVGGTGLTRGELHGVVRMTDVTGKIIPAIADVLTQIVRKMPGTPAAEQIILFFETQKKCMDMPALCCRRNPMTCRILPEEVQNNSAVQNALKPDVQMFDGDKWAPNKNAEKPDSMSVGICFTAVGAKY